jgi:hypothetical protein
MQAKAVAAMRCSRSLDQTAYRDWFGVKMRTRVKLEGNRFTAFIYPKRDNSLPYTARVLQSTIVVVMYTAGVINFHPIKIFCFQNRHSGHDDHMSGIPGFLGRSLEFPSDYVASLCVAKLTYRFPPGERLPAQPIQELKVHRCSRTCMPGFNG